jgi:hypothetical protein
MVPASFVLGRTVGPFRSEHQRSQIVCCGWMWLQLTVIKWLEATRSAAPIVSAMGMNIVPLFRHSTNRMGTVSSSSGPSAFSFYTCDSLWETSLPRLGQFLMLMKKRPESRVYGYTVPFKPHFTGSVRGAQPACDRISRDCNVYIPMNCLIWTPILAWTLTSIQNVVGRRVIDWTRVGVQYIQIHSQYNVCYRCPAYLEESPTSLECRWFTFKKKNFWSCWICAG